MCSLRVHRADDGVRAGVSCAVPWVRQGWVLGPTPLMDTEGTLGLQTSRIWAQPKPVQAPVKDEDL